MSRRWESDEHLLAALDRLEGGGRSHILSLVGVIVGGHVTPGGTASACAEGGVSWRRIKIVYAFASREAATLCRIVFSCVVWLKALAPCGGRVADVIFVDCRFDCYHRYRLATTLRCATHSVRAIKCYYW